MSTDIWAGDRLNRKGDAAWLYTYLLRRNAMALADGERGTSLSINAAWGTGKTYFLKRFAEELRLKEHRVAEVNAWQDDHAEDPLFAVMAAVLTALGRDSGGAKLREVLTDNAGKIAIRATKGVAKRVAAFFIGEKEAEGIADDIARGLADAADETLTEIADQALDRFNQAKKAIQDFRAQLAEAVADQSPLFVLVDELDRCRPTYAIALLERVKHLFDVPNVIFVVATHMGQLAHTIRAVYGEGFDADRYLHRFFDQQYRFEKPQLSAFVAARWQALDLKEDRFLALTRTDIVQTDIIENVALAKDLSLRDVNQCMDMLWSVAEFSNHKVQLPLAWVFPLIVAHHLNEAEAFEFATSTAGRLAPADHPHGRFFDDKPVLAFTGREPRTGQIRRFEVSLKDFANVFSTVLEKGLFWGDGTPGTGYAAEYADRYRSNELGNLHNNRVGNARIPSILEQIGSRIQRAGQFGTVST